MTPQERAERKDRVISFIERLRNTDSDGAFARMRASLEAEGTVQRGQSEDYYLGYLDAVYDVLDAFAQLYESQSEICIHYLTALGKGQAAATVLASLAVDYLYGTNPVAAASQADEFDWIPSELDLEAK